MTSKILTVNSQTIYIETPRSRRRPEKIDSVLKKRMQAFTRERQRRLRREAQR